MITGDGTVLLSRVQHVIKPFEPLFHALNNLINTLKLRKAHGCAILDIVYKVKVTILGHSFVFNPSLCAFRPASRVSPRFKRP